MEVGSNGHEGLNLSSNSRTDCIAPLMSDSELVASMKNVAFLFWRGGITDEGVGTLEYRVGSGWVRINLGERFGEIMEGNMKDETEAVGL